MHTKGKMAIVGAGRWGRNVLASFSRVTDIACIIHAGDSETNRWLGKTYPGLPISSSLKTALEDTSVTALIIATPIETHAEIARLALKNGKDVFVEKPLCTDPEEAWALARLATEQKRIFMVGYIYLYHEIFKTLKQKVSSQKIKALVGNWDKLGTFHEDGIWNLGSHELALAMGLCGTPRSLRVVPISSKYGTHDIFSLHGECEGDIPFSFSVNRLFPYRRKTLTCITDSHSYTWEDNRLYESQDEKVPELIHMSTSAPLDDERDAFLSALETRIPPVTDGDFGAQVTESIVKAINASQ